MKHLTSALALCLLASTAFAAEAAKVETTKSGIEITTVVEGKGKAPTAADTVTVHYKGTLQDGTEFDSSYKRGKPATFPLGRVVPCWTEGVQKIKEGGKARLVCPPELAYGSRGVPGVIPPNATLVFEVEVLKVM
ncbi:FKBP-type peptidyl-prolyl cis-trans isomerase [Chitinibacter bivalviorum]|uniref:Peptidyl-prolyl cis-trans isomerase n=1 Tax=Chitinibacter bivalviorum TaxID=2739434 RepID=A0A7H9BMP6_9NEIS|nr:FKBP-type peptidyl-prolyl cis-trans isomerase [Chitinibacter bivalviorum]QLG89361.1 FKBP-type peptidyl-prolyl cis-trans isomerase [Chitinibacter bivalviorum]